MKSSIEKYKNKHEEGVEITKSGLLKLWHRLEASFGEMEGKSAIRKGVGLEKKIPTYMQKFHMSSPFFNLDLFFNSNDRATWDPHFHSATVLKLEEK